MTIMNILANRPYATFALKPLLENDKEFFEEYKRKKVIVLRTMTKNNAFFLLIHKDYQFDFFDLRKRYHKMISEGNNMPVYPQGTIGYYAFYPVGYEEVVDMTTPFSYLIDIDGSCAEGESSEKFLGAIYDMIQRYYPDHIDAMYKITDKRITSLDENEMNRLGQYRYRFEYIITIFNIAAQECLKYLGSDLEINFNRSRHPDEGTMVPINSAWKYHAKVNHYKRDHRTLTNLDRKISLHLNFLSIYMENNEAAKIFTMRIIFWIFGMYIISQHQDILEVHECIFSMSKVGINDPTDDILDITSSVFRNTGINVREYSGILDILYNMVDIGIYSRQHNMRMLYEYKEDDDRCAYPVTKTIYGPPGILACLMTGSCKNMSFIADYYIASTSSGEYRDNIKNTYEISDDFIKSIVHKIEKDYNQFRFDHVATQDGRETFINFVRISPDRIPCKFCNRKHDSDNSLYLSVSYSENGSRAVFMHCRRDRNKGSSLVVSESVSRNLEMHLDMCISNSYADVFYSDHEFKNLQRDTEFFRTNNPVVLPEDVLFDNYDASFIHAGMGSGKTKALMEYMVKQISRPEPRFVSVSFRRTQANEMCAKYNEHLNKHGIKSCHFFANYQDKKRDFNASRNYVVQVESLGNIALSGLKRYEYILILDEVMSIIQQFDSENVRRAGNQLKTIFFWLIAHAKKVICMDAHMTYAPVELYRACKRLHNKEIGSINFYCNDSKSHERMTYNIVQDKHHLLSMLLHQVSKNMRCVVATSSKRKAEEISLAIQERFPNKKIKLYTSDTSDSEKNHDFADVNTHWANVDVLIYSPTMGAGISYENISSSFDVLFGYFVSMSCNAEADIQMLGRIRNFKEKRAYIYVSPAKYNVPVTKNDIFKVLHNEYSESLGLCNTNKQHEELLGKRARERIRPTVRNYIETIIDSDGLWIIDDAQSPGNILEISIELQKNRSYANLQKRIIDILGTMSNNIRLFMPPDDMEFVPFNGYEELYKCRHAEEIVEAKDLTKEEYVDLITKSSRGEELSAKEKIELKKKGYSKFFNVRSDCIDRLFVKEQCFDRLDKYKILSIIPNCRDVQESLEIMHNIDIQNCIQKVLSKDPMIKNRFDRDGSCLSRDILILMNLLGVTDMALRTEIKDYDRYVDLINQQVSNMKKYIDGTRIRLVKRDEKKKMAKGLCTLLNNTVGQMIDCVFSSLDDKVVYDPPLNYLFQMGSWDREINVGKFPKVMPPKNLYREYFHEEEMTELEEMYMLAEAEEARKNDRVGYDLRELKAEYEREEKEEAKKQSKRMKMYREYKESEDESEDCTRPKFVDDDFVPRRTNDNDNENHKSHRPEFIDDEPVSCYRRYSKIRR